MAVKNKRRHIKLKFLNVCIKVEFEFPKIFNYMAFLDQSVDEYLQKKLMVSQFLTFALANYSNQFISLMTEKLKLKELCSYQVLSLPLQ
jgi:hypothetical protein